jgi:protein TonB
MRGKLTSWIVSVGGHVAAIAFLLLGLPFFQKPIMAEERFQGVEVLLLAAVPPPEPVVVHVPPPPPPPPLEPDPIVSKSLEPDLEPAPPPKPKPVVRKPEPPRPPQPKQEIRPAVETSSQPVPQPPQPQVAMATPAPVSSAPRANVNPDAEANYFATLLAWLEKNKEYPRRAQLRRMEGVTHLRFVIDEQGRVLSHRIERSSGHETLDDAVERMIAKASPLPPIPPNLGKTRLDVVVPVQFFLK